jgi:hypothetical protein
MTILVCFGALVWAVLVGWGGAALLRVVSDAESCGRCDETSG